MHTLKSTLLLCGWCRITGQGKGKRGSFQAYSSVSRELLRSRILATAQQPSEPMSLQFKLFVQGGRREAPFLHGMARFMCICARVRGCPCMCVHLSLSLTHTHTHTHTHTQGTYSKFFRVEWLCNASAMQIAPSSPSALVPRLKGQQVKYKTSNWYQVLSIKGACSARMSRVWTNLRDWRSLLCSRARAIAFAVFGPMSLLLRLGSMRVPCVCEQQK